jgi:hypothetical protein
MVVRMAVNIGVGLGLNGMGWHWKCYGMIWYCVGWYVMGWFEMVSELRKPASSTSTLAKHSVILQERFDCQHSKFTFLSKIQPNSKQITL